MSALPPKAGIHWSDWNVRFVPKADMERLFDPVGVQQDGEPDRLANGFKLDFGNPVALAPAQAGLFILALEA